MFTSLPTTLDALVQRLVTGQRLILLSTSIIMAVVFFLVVILRYILQTDLFAYEEWILMIAFWMYFIGGAHGSYENSHIKADFIQVLLRQPRQRQLFSNLALAIEAGIGLVLCYWGGLMMLEEVSAYPNWQRTSAWQLPFAIPRGAIFLGFCLMTFYTLLHLYSNLRTGPTLSSPSQPEEPTC